MFPVGLPIPYAHHLENATKEFRYFDLGRRKQICISWLPALENIIQWLFKDELVGSEPMGDDGCASLNDEFNNISIDLSQFGLRHSAESVEQRNYVCYVLMQSYILRGLGAKRSIMNNGTAEKGH